MFKGLLFLGLCFSLFACTNAEVDVRILDPHKVPGANLNPIESPNEGQPSGEVGDGKTENGEDPEEENPTPGSGTTPSQEVVNLVGVVISDNANYQTVTLKTKQGNILTSVTNSYGEYFFSLIKEDLPVLLFFEDYYSFASVPGSSTISPLTTLALVEFSKKELSLSDNVPPVSHIPTTILKNKLNYVWSLDSLDIFQQVSYNLSDNVYVNNNLKSSLLFQLTSFTSFILSLKLDVVPGCVYGMSETPQCGL